MRRTKIVCTIGPATCRYEQLEKLAEGGMNVARLNMSHGDHQWHKKVIKAIHTINQKGKYSIAVLLDTKGAEVRSGDLKKEVVLKKGERFIFTVRREAEYGENTTEVSYDGFIEEVKVGDVILVDGGLTSFKVIEKTKTDIVCECLEGGTLSSRRHLNIKGKTSRGPSITKRDWKDIKFGIEKGVDFIALSFVKNAKAIKDLKDYLTKKKASIDVLAKIESAAAILKLQEILEASDGVMIARGDLGAEVPLEEIPLIQKDIVYTCRKLKKPVIIATHLLESMIVHPTPTRAEVADVAGAVSEKVDTLMLSGETATGRYPLKALSIIDRVARRIEEELASRHLPGGPTSSAEALTSSGEGRMPACADRDSWKVEEYKKPLDPKEEIAKSAAVLANNLKSPAILVFTRRGLMAVLLSHARPNSQIFAFTNTTTVRRRLNLYWGVTPFRIDFSKDPEKTIQRAFLLLKKREYLKGGEEVIVVSDILAGKEFVETIQVRRIK